MSAADIQLFLERPLLPAVRTRRPAWRDYRVDTPTPAGVAGRCTALRGARNERASSIIARVAQACTISPRVLLVLLQKEQSLLTAPSASGYQKATGYACPDTAACDAKYFGFFNQVYRAAWQFREYTVHPKDWRYRIGTNRIQYHPDASCGAGKVHDREPGDREPVQLHAVPAERRDARDPRRARAAPARRSATSTSRGSTTSGSARR